jgi:hypothetical protein
MKSCSAGVSPGSDGADCLAISTPLVAWIASVMRLAVTTARRRTRTRATRANLDRMMEQDTARIASDPSGSRHTTGTKESFVPLVLVVGRARRSSTQS